MSIATDLTTIAENTPKVYEAGKEAERRAFWDVFQDKGNRSSYPYAFYRWNDEPYNPIYDIITDDSVGMYSYSRITDTRVKITLTGNLSSTFYMATVLKTIRELVLTTETSLITSTFQQANKLEDLTVSGEGRFVGTFSMQYCKLLTVKSLISVIEHLKVTVGTSMESKYRVTFSAECWNRLEETTPPEGYETWKDYVMINKGWLV